MNPVFETFDELTLAWVVAVVIAVLAVIGIGIWIWAAAKRRRKEAPPPRKGLQLQLGKAREGLFGRIQQALGGETAEVYAELEEILVTSDFGIETTEYLLQKVREQAASTGEIDAALRAAVLEVFHSARQPGDDEAKPKIIMIVGVNGVGKTTTIGKLAHQYAGRGKRVLLAAGDTFRAAAGDQLAVWAERSGSDIVRGQPDADPAAVCFDAVKAGLARGADVVICDTAGRLHTKSNLMEELKKVKRVMGKAMEGAPHEFWLVVDATTGQNALSQGRLFHQAVGITGIVITKMDGTAKGGTSVGLVRELGVPVRFIGVGEGIDDLRPFEPEAYVEAVLGG
jgi:fused signal recognition particle receptor